MHLYSRYGDAWELTEIESGYVFKVPDYTRFGLFPDSDKDICFVDPPGGPFLEVGGKIGEDEIIVNFLDQGNSMILIKTHKKEGSK